MDRKLSKRRRYQSNKSMKHLLERQRRARINQSLGELKGLVLSAIHQGNPQADLNGCEKMEKAEILELTVSYIKAIRSHVNVGEWTTNYSNSQANYNLEYQCLHTNTTSKEQSTQNRPGDADTINYRPQQHATMTSSSLHSDYQCSGRKPYCACLNSAHYGMVTPPLSPALSSGCVNTQHNVRGQPLGSYRPWRPSVDTRPDLQNLATSSCAKVWRPW